MSADNSTRPFEATQKSLKLEEDLRKSILREASLLSAIDFAVWQLDRDDSLGAYKTLVEMAAILCSKPDGEIN